MELPYTCDYAKSSRAVCRGCYMKILKDILRVAIMLQSRTFDGLVPNWYHMQCFFIEHMPSSTKEIDNFKSLRPEDRKEIQEIIASGESPFASEENRKHLKRSISSANSKASLIDYKIDQAKNGQTKCDYCDSSIKKSEIRIFKKLSKGKQWYHLNCFAKVRTTIDFLEPGSSITGFDDLEDEDQEEVKKILPGINDVTPIKKKRLSTNKKSKNETFEDNEYLDIMNQYRKELKENLNKNEIALLLKSNRQAVPSGLDKMIDRASDMLTFGAVEKCRSCYKGQLVFTNSGYRCAGNSGGQWSKCTAVRKDARRMMVEVPLELKLRHTFLYKYDYVERERKITTFNSEKITNGPLKHKNIVISGFSNEEKSSLYSKVKALAGRVVPEVRRSVFAIIATEEEVKLNTKCIQQAEEQSVYVVQKGFLDDLFQERHYYLDDLARKHSLVKWGSELHNRVPQKYVKNGQSSSNYNRRNMEEEEEEGKRRMYVKGGIAIEPDSCLDHIAHVYQTGAVKFNAVLSRADVVKNQNTYYKIQLLEADDTEDYWLYRGWGRIGTTVGSCKVEKMESLTAAKKAFKECFKQRTGYSWEKRFAMEKKPGKFIMVDVNYDAQKEEIMDLRVFVADSTLKPAVAELMAIIFNVQSMEKIMLEYQLDLKKMPLGKLSRTQISAAYNILNQASWVLKNNPGNNREIISVTNMFYSYMPYNSNLERPPLLDNLELIKQKSEMLANLMEMETAYAMIQRGAEGEGGNILDAYYNQLKAYIDVIHEDSDEYQIIQEYVQNTHADTHRHYDLKILEVFKVGRHGEEDRYKAFKNLHNRRLLWHGSRTTNYAGILSQGLRIAPPEAPMTGYMFGKGIYFADMVSKSANYCCTTSEDSTGLLLLCEVALGNMSDKLRAEPIKRLPNGSHSVRGIGRTEPDPSAMKTLEDGVQVPLGKPVTNVDCQSSLLYNEYIVYDIAQVNIKYLLKMDFKYNVKA